MPRNFVHYPGKSIGYPVTNVPYLFEFNKATANIDKVRRLPPIRDGRGWDMKITNDENAYISQGDYFLKMDMNNLNIIGNYPLPAAITDTTSIWGFTLSPDNSRVYAITNEYAGQLDCNIFTAVDTTTFQLAARYQLQGNSFANRPFILPDSSKLYAIGGLINGGQVIIHVIRTDTLTIHKTITFEQPGENGPTGPSGGLAYDPASQTLYVGCMKVVLAIDTINDTIKKVIYLRDLAIDNGADPWLYPSINAGGLIYNPIENYLYIDHCDDYFISIYDLTNNRFLPRLIPIMGFGASDILSNDDYSKIFVVNGWSDNISVIDVATKSFERLIDLHDYLEIHKIYLPLILNISQ
jgi:DNA-binding beta-propeller fold protein YncE